MAQDISLDFDQFVCSGGGTRCVWQGGWLHVVRDEIDLTPQRITGVSGGAGTAAGFIARRGQDFIDRLCEAFDNLDRNIDPHELEGDGLSAHQRVYREVVADVFDEKTMDKIAQGPAFEVLLGHPPSGTWSKLTGTAATAAYEAELHIIGSPHFNWAEQFGVSASRVDGRQAAQDGLLADLIGAAAVIPPVFEPPQWEGKAVIDGGMTDQAPLPEPDQGHTLVLLTRDYSKLPEVENRLYVSPSEEVEADKIDFTDPGKLRRTWEQGEADGRAFLDRYNSHHT
ncbi:MAG: patatin-like phospholipase family protein [Sulfitobacter sp.]|nr:patatin-like phospholipase family protein [Sulfitobacter sp.]